LGVSAVCDSTAEAHLNDDCNDTGGVVAPALSGTPVFQRH